MEETFSRRSEGYKVGRCDPLPRKRLKDPGVHGERYIISVTVKTPRGVGLTPANSCPWYRKMVIRDIEVLVLLKRTLLKIVLGVSYIICDNHGYVGSLGNQDSFSSTNQYECHSPMWVRSRRRHSQPRCPNVYTGRGLLVESECPRRSGSL